MPIMRDRLTPRPVARLSSACPRQRIKASGSRPVAERGTSTQRSIQVLIERELGLAEPDRMNRRA
jgi:hypothetical protein